MKRNLFTQGLSVLTASTAMLAYDFTPHFTLSAGYQALALDESEGSGTSEKCADLIFSGVAAGLTFKF
jgi:hypothetical protein